MAAYVEYDGVPGGTIHKKKVIAVAVVAKVVNMAAGYFNVVYTGRDRGPLGGWLAIHKDPAVEVDLTRQRRRP